MPLTVMLCKYQNILAEAYFWQTTRLGVPLVGDDDQVHGSHIGEGGGGGGG